MRCIALVALLISLMAIPASAEIYNSQSSSTQSDERLMGGGICSKRFSCAETGTFAGSLSPIADACLMEVFRKTSSELNEEGFSSGVMGNDNCIRNNTLSGSDNNNKGSGYRCCVFTLGQDQCAMRCDRVVLR